MKYDYEPLKKYVLYIEKKGNLIRLQSEQRNSMETELKKQRDNFEKIQRKKRRIGE